MDNEKETLIHYIGLRRDETVWRRIEPLLQNPKVLSFNAEVLRGIHWQMFGKIVRRAEAQDQLHRLMPIYCHRAHFESSPYHVPFVVAAMDRQVYRYKNFPVVMTFDGLGKGFPVEWVRLRFVNNRAGHGPIKLGNYIHDQSKIIPATLAQAEALAERVFPYSLQAVSREVTGERDSHPAPMERKARKRSLASNKPSQCSLLVAAGYSACGDECSCLRPDGECQRKAPRSEVNRQI